MILLQARTRLFVGVFCLVLLLALAPCPVYASTQEADTLPLTVSEVSASSISHYSATISWETNYNATSQVFYDTASHNTTAEYAYHSSEDTALVTEHRVSLTGLSAGTTYHYRVRSAIPDTEAIAISEDYTFGTSSPAPAGDGAPAGDDAPSTFFAKADLFGTDKTFYTDYKGEVQNTIEAISGDGLLTLTIPKGTTALDKDSKRLKSLEVAVDESPPDPVEDAHIIGLAYDFGPAGAMFSPQITLTWNYDPDVLPEGVTEESLIMAYYDESVGEWIGLVCGIDAVNNTITASVSHFTTFAIIGSIMPPPVPPVPPVPPAPAGFLLSNLTIQPAEVEPGETVTITVSLANTGGTKGRYTVVLKINDAKEAEKAAAIAAGSSLGISFSVTKEEIGNYSVTVDRLSGTFAVVAPVEEEVDGEVPTKPVNYWPWIGGIIGGVIFVILVIVGLARSGKLKGLRRGRL